MSLPALRLFTSNGSPFCLKARGDSSYLTSSPHGSTQSPREPSGEARWLARGSALQWAYPDFSADPALFSRSGHGPRTRTGPDRPHHAGLLDRTASVRSSLPALAAAVDLRSFQNQAHDTTLAPRPARQDPLPPRRRSRSHLRLGKYLRLLGQHLGWQGTSTTWDVGAFRSSYDGGVGERDYGRCSESAVRARR